MRKVFVSPNIVNTFDINIGGYVKVSSYDPGKIIHFAVSGDAKVINIEGDNIEIEIDMSQKFLYTSSDGSNMNLLSSLVIDSIYESNNIIKYIIPKHYVWDYTDKLPN